VVGRGPLQGTIDELIRDFPGQVTSVSWLDPADVARLLDDSTLLAMSSESEGLPRVAMEAFARGRPIVATAAGGIPDIVKNGRNGMLVERGNAQQLADSILRVLEDPAFAEQLATGALEDGKKWQWPLDDYPRKLRQFVESGLQSAGSARPDRQ
jgi:glycosyltransferase involved in cell wall biosynthesis